MLTLTLILSVLHASCLYVCFVNIFVFILTEIHITLSDLFYTNSVIFVDVNVNVDLENAMHSDLVICNNSNYKVLPAVNFDFIGLQSSQLLPTDITPEKKCSNDYCFSLALFIFPIMFAHVFLGRKHKAVKAFFECITFLLSITKSNLFTKNDILKSTSEIFTYESIDVYNLLHTSYLHNACRFFALAKFKYINKDSFFKVLLLLLGDISLNPGPSLMNQSSGNNEWDLF